MSTNDITGDALKSGVSTDEYRDGWDRIFGGKPKPAPKPLNESLNPLELQPSEKPKIRPAYPTVDEGNTPD